MQAILKKPVVCFQGNTDAIATLPCGAVIELSDQAEKAGLVDVAWNGQTFSVFRDDLLDVCTVDDVVRISFR